jgi:hypothetical protein
MTSALLIAALLTAPHPPRGAAPSVNELPPPASSAELAERLEVAFGMIHGAPSPAFWRSLGPDAIPELERVARDPAAFPSRRARALEGLGYLGGARARGLLVEMARDGALPLPVRSAALDGAGHALPASELAQQLGPVLRGAADPTVRALAAEVLALHAPEIACAAVRAQVAREPRARRDAFQRGLDRCAGR